MVGVIKEKLEETEEVELKKNLNDTFVKEVVAFLNTHSGVIYIGIEDDGNVCGVNNLDKLMKEISDIVALQILPNAQELVNVTSIFKEGKLVIEVKVEKGDRLYYIKKYGKSEKGCYVRVGTTCRSLSEEQIERIILRDAIENRVSIVNIPSRD